MIGPGPSAMSAASSSKCSTVPSRSVTATAMLVAPRSATRRCPDSASKRSWRGGRPPVLGPMPDSVTRPRSRSSATRCATTVRDRPVRCEISSRERACPRRTASRTAVSVGSASTARRASEMPLGSANVTRASYFCVSSPEVCRLQANGHAQRVAAITSLPNRSIASLSATLGSTIGSAMSTGVAAHYPSIRGPRMSVPMAW